MGEKSHMVRSVTGTKDALPAFTGPAGYRPEPESAHAFP